MWITLLDPFALHAPFYHLQSVVFGLMEKDVLCATMTITVGVDSGFSWGVSFLILYHIKLAKNKKKKESSAAHPGRARGNKTPT